MFHLRKASFEVHIHDKSAQKNLKTCHKYWGWGAALHTPMMEEKVMAEWQILY